MKGVDEAERVVVVVEAKVVHEMTAQWADTAADFAGVPTAKGSSLQVTTMSNVLAKRKWISRCD